MRQNQGILPKYRRLVSFIICIALGLASSLFLATGAMFTLVAQGSIAPIARLEKPLFNLAEQEKQGRQFYENGQFGNAVLVWQQVLKTYQSHNDHLNQARVWSNLSLAYQRLGQWSLAQKAIANSLELATFKPEKNSPEQLQVLAQVLNTQGSLELGRGNGQAALDIWQKAGETYSKAKNETGVIRSYINQSKALKSLGLYRRALSTLLKVQKMLAAQPDSLMKVVALRNLGNSLRLVNQLEQGEQVLRQGLKLAQKLRSPSDISGSFIDLGNLARTQEKSKSAVDYYQQAIDTAPSIAIKIHAQLNQLSTFIHIEDWEKGKALVNQIQSQLINLPNSRSVIYAQLNLANSLITLHQAKVSGTSNLEAIAKLVATSYEQAQKLGDPQASTYALGKLGGLYEKNQQWSMAKKLTQQALAIAQNTNTPEIIYLWQWQLGRILKAEGDIPGAIANYQEAVKNLQSLRSNLAAFDTDLQFNFREKVEPVYRELVSLLLQPNSSNTPNQDKENLKLGTNNKSLSQADLKLIEQARQIIESLQLAELNNFFREACLDTSTTQVDRIDTEAAVIYPIILRERLEIILSLPKRPLTHYSISIPQNQLEETVEKLRQNLVIRTRYTFKPSAQKLYEWLIRPLENELAQNGINTLVFVPDGVLRNIPMAVLHDGKQYLVEKYSIALSPGMQLLQGQSLQE